MNTNFVSQVTQFFMFYLVAALIAVIALRAASHKSVRSTRLFEWDESGETPRWQPVGLDVSTGNFGWTWGKGFGPRWTRENEEGKRVPITAIAFSQFNRSDAHTEERFLGKDQKWFLLVKPQFSVSPAVKMIYGLLGLILVIFAFWQVSPRIFTSVPTVVAATARSVQSTGIATSTQAPYTVNPSQLPVMVTWTPSPGATSTRTPLALVTLSGQTNTAPSPTLSPTAPTAPTNSNSPIGGLLLIGFGFILGAVVATIFWQRQKNK